MLESNSPVITELISHYLSICNMLRISIVRTNMGHVYSNVTLVTDIGYPHAARISLPHVNRDF